MNISRSDFKRIVVAVDPATTSGDNSDETGIIVVAQGPHMEIEHSDRSCTLANCSRHGYVLEDASGKFTPDGWANVVVGLFHKWSADRIVAEGNQGGEMVESVIRSVYPSAPFKRVHARQGKRTRAEPVAALYEQGRVHHCGSFPLLEDQLTTWTTDSGESPDRLDALVWGLVELGLTKYSGGKEWIEAMAIECTCGQINERGQQRCIKCGLPLVVDEPEAQAPDQLPVDPVPFSLTSGRDVYPANYDSNKAVMDAIKQFGPTQWTPFRR
jgi:phage terminase large subunit-like protein